MVVNNSKVMSPNAPNSSTDQENTKDKEQTPEESVLENAYDPEDLVQKGYSTLDPAEIGSNPALAPETVTLNDPAEVREGYKFD
jgi:hypothetical protein